ncbi:sodium/proton antiporter, NhaA family [Streptomyces zhaozhouensis]|uniref:Na(+)/H(+) antiporter NhaA n=1 Tax=Streptomyces zhaozhouensis TaxID=1300267 RepID=A0A286E2H0_9ACTN|nr:Na+/H+ antiporter NhaA [Streptomyces zhaozhouensis]SOD65095.1 sodium/proton antiporter, NhaA family [Streptomyces zhaozhouensis]
MTPPRLPSPLPKIARRLPPAERDRRSVAEFLRLEVTGGMLLLVAAALALFLANSPWSAGYESVRDHHLEIPFLGLDLSVGHWAADGLLAVFFFVAGTELKRELTVGELRRPAAAALPVMAAIGGMVTPALIYLAVALPSGGASDGWAVPMATDIAFALGVLAVVGRRLPSALRTFLLTLAIVDDLIAILVIAVFFTSELDVLALAGAAAGLLLFRLLHTRGVRGWYWYVPLALAVWTLTYHSGVHATVAGVALGMLLRATPRDDEESTPAEHIGHLVHPFSAGLAVPLFALFAAGVPVSAATLGEMAGEPEALGVVLGLFLGKLIGVFGATYLTARFTKARLNPQLGWPDVAGTALLAGIGFTVSLLIAELAFAGDPAMTEHVKAAVLLTSLLAATSAALMLTLRGRRLARSGDSTSP